MHIKLHVKFRNKDFQLVIDKILLLEFFKDLSGRFWGVVGVLGIILGFLISFLIRPDLRDVTTTFSLFGTDTKTAPYFILGLIFGAFGLWKWRTFLTKTTERPGLTASLISLTILGLYIVALMPLEWTPKVTALHYFGFSLVGFSAAATVIVDLLMHKTRPRRDKLRWQIIRLIAIVFIVTGLIITALSSTVFNNYINKGLIGESLIILGYTSWVFIKTYQGLCISSNIADKLHEIFSLQ